MDCRVCGGAVDDPFWDEICHECYHELNHEGRMFDANCQDCLWDADDRHEQGYDQLPDIAGIAHNSEGEATA